MANQLTFDLALPPPTYAREDFVTASGNREALAWIDRWPDWPAPALALGGPAGCGKNHLGRIWAARAGAISIDGTALEDKSVADLSELAAASPTIVIENADRAPERALFHLYNLMRERRGFLLLIATALPAHWSIALPDLASRLRWELGSRLTMISETLTPSACSSSSARPVRRATPLTSGCDRRTRSTARPSWSDCWSEVPGSVTALMVKAHAALRRFGTPRGEAGSWRCVRGAPPAAATPVDRRLFLFRDHATRVRCSAGPMLPSSLNSVRFEALAYRPVN